MEIPEDQRCAHKKKPTRETEDGECACRTQRFPPLQPQRARLAESARLKETTATSRRSTPLHKSTRHAQLLKRRGELRQIDTYNGFLVFLNRRDAAKNG